ncbi:MAG: TetR/AcrR family transcriptional regulator [Thermodesulfobacteriota bacterium]
MAARSERAAARPRAGGAKTAAAARRRTPPARVSRKQQGEQTRRAILEAAVELYAESGFRGVGLMAIGERAGVHHATVLYHYKSSRELLLAVLAERDRRFLAFSREALRGGGLAALRNLPVVARFNLEHPVWAKLFTVLREENLDPNGEAHAYFVARRREAHRMVTRDLRTAKRRGEIRPDVDEDVTATAILAFTAGAQIQHFLDPANVDLIAVYERFTRMLIDDLTRGMAR